MLEPDGQTRRVHPVLFEYRCILWYSSGLEGQIMREMPKPYERYKHFKGREYQVLLIAKNEKTMEDMVVYQALYEPYHQVFEHNPAPYTGRIRGNAWPLAHMIHMIR